MSDCYETVTMTRKNTYKKRNRKRRMRRIRGRGGGEAGMNMEGKSEREDNGE